MNKFDDLINKNKSIIDNAEAPKQLEIKIKSAAGKTKNGNNSIEPKVNLFEWIAAGMIISLILTMVVFNAPKRKDLDRETSGANATNVPLATVDFTPEVTVPQTAAVIIEETPHPTQTPSPYQAISVWRMHNAAETPADMKVFISQDQENFILVIDQPSGLITKKIPKINTDGKPNFMVYPQVNKDGTKVAFLFGQETPGNRIVNYFGEILIFDVSTGGLNGTDIFTGSILDQNGTPILIKYFWRDDGNTLAILRGNLYNDDGKYLTDFVGAYDTEKRVITRFAEGNIGAGTISKDKNLIMYNRIDPESSYPGERLDRYVYDFRTGKNTKISTKTFGLESIRSAASMGNGYIDVFIDEEHIVYTKDNKVYKYNVLTGVETSLYEADGPIWIATVSPDYSSLYCFVIKYAGEKIAKKLNWQAGYATDLPWWNNKTHEEIQEIILK